jgi:hypothetical protein
MYGPPQRVFQRPDVVRVGGLLVVAVLIAGFVGLLIGRSSNGSPSSARDGSQAVLPVVSKGSLDVLHGPTRMWAELPVGFTRDEAGALSCAAIAGEALIDYVQIRRTTSAQSWIAAYTTETLGAPSLQRIYDWDPKLYQQAASFRPANLPVARSATSVSELVPVGYKLLAFSTTAAHVQVWFHGAGWSHGSEFPNTVVDRSADVQLVWRDGDWKITSYTNPPGQAWNGPGLDDPQAKGFVPWPGGQFTFVTG